MIKIELVELHGGNSDVYLVVPEMLREHVGDKNLTLDGLGFQKAKPSISGVVRAIGTGHRYIDSKKQEFKVLVYCNWNSSEERWKMCGFEVLSIAS